MTTTEPKRRIAIGTSLALAVGVLLALGLSGAFLATPAHAEGSPIAVADGATQQWAFGGIASASYSCTGTACGDGTNISSISLHYYVEWVVIYTVTNISATQTEVEAQAAINASVSLSLAGCVSLTTGSPCSAVSANANIAGRETASGFTNVTNTGTVNLTAGTGSPASVAALAVMNAESSASFNFSGAYTESLSGFGTAAINFDLGGSETSSVAFATPLGIVPLSPVPGQSWNASAAYLATGSYTSGYSLGESVNGSAVHNVANWQNSVVSPSGTLEASGTDLGAYTLTDNYTSPPTTVTAQAILVTFSTGDFTATDGWLVLPSGLYDGAEGFTGGAGLIAGPHPDASTVGGNESAYYQSGVGFIGVDESASSSSLGVSSGPSISLQAGPEPVAVAEQQYSAITAPSGSSSGLPWTWLILAVVVVVVVVVAALAVRRSRRRPPASASMAGYNQMYAPSSAPAAPAGPTAPTPPSTSPAMAGAIASTIPVCVSCGQPGTYVAQYGRYYCYHDNRYL
ncbi:MAG TPA: hypothetical protein VMI55_05445 [Thermoplasmata archaeon]|nr:hypothetical protein [Thermoplasmata archaeon]